MMGRGAPYHRDGPVGPAARRGFAASAPPLPSPVIAVGMYWEVFGKYWESVIRPVQLLRIEIGDKEL